MVVIFTCLMLGTKLTEKIQDWSGIEIFVLMGMGHPFHCSTNTKEFTQMSTISNCSWIFLRNVGFDKKNQNLNLSPLTQHICYWFFFVERAKIQYCWLVLNDEIKINEKSYQNILSLANAHKLNPSLQSQIISSKYLKKNLMRLIDLLPFWSDVNFSLIFFFIIKYWDFWKN